MTSSRKAIVWLGMWLGWVALMVSAVSSPAWAQGTITTVAGSNWVFQGNNGPATNATMGRPQAVATDSAGNVYVADTPGHLVFKITAAGTLTIVAGTGERGFSSDGGPATSARLQFPEGIAVDAVGNIYITDGGSRVRKVSTSGIITTVAGTGNFFFSGDGGPATSASMAGARHLFVDNTGNLYIVEENSHRIRKVNTAGIISTVAGNGTAGFSGDNGPATSASLNLGYGAGVAVDGAGNIYISDLFNNRIRKVNTAGTITTIAGTGVQGPFGDGGPALNAQLNNPKGLTVDTAGNIYIATDYTSVRKIDTSGNINTIAGSSSNFGFGGDGGPATSAAMREPRGVALDTANNLYIADADNYRIRKVDTGGTITTFAGNGIFKTGGDGGPATSAFLHEPRGMVVDGTGNIYITDSVNHRVRKVDSGGTITTFAGAGRGCEGDGGPATSATLDFPDGLARDGAGNIYIKTCNRIRKVSSTGTITAFAGTGEFNYSGDNGPATSATLRLIFDVGNLLAVDGSNNVYIVDTFNHRIRKVDTNGNITTVAGSGFTFPLGDGGPATSAGLNTPQGVAVDSLGNLYIADTENGRVRKVDTGGTITTVAGNGGFGFGGDGGAATNATLNRPRGIAVDSNGHLYIGDSDNQRIRRVLPNGTIFTVVGTGNFSFSGDGGPALSATLASPRGLALDTGGNLYIADTFNDRIRKVAGATDPITFSVPAGVNFTMPSGAFGSQAVFISSTVTGLQWTSAASTNNGGNWLSPITSSGSTPGTITISANATGLAPGIYTGNFTVTAPLADPTSKIIAVTLTVVAPAAPPGPGINTVAGSSWVFPFATGPALNAPFGQFQGVAVDANGNLFATDSGNDLVVKISPGGTFAIIAGTSRCGSSGDNGPATFAQLCDPEGVAVDGAGNVYIADQSNSRIRKVDTAGIITTVAGNGTAGFAGDNGAATSAQLNFPRGVAVDSAGNLYIADTNNHRIRKVTGGTITTVAGDGFAGFSGDDGFATLARLNSPRGVAVDASGNLFIADTNNHRIRYVGAFDGMINTLVGNGTAGFNGDGTAVNMSLNSPHGVAFAPPYIYIADTNNNRIRRVATPNGVTITGTGAVGFSGDGSAATSAVLNGPLGVAADASGNVYIADTLNWRVRKVNSGGTISTLAGNGLFKFSGDGGPATSANMNFVIRATLDGAGNLFVVDQSGNRVRKITPSGTITTVAGNGIRGFCGDGGAAINACLQLPSDVAVDGSGNLYIADLANHRIRMVTPAGTISTFAGNGVATYAGDGGPAASASLNFPEGVAVDASNNLYIADTNNHRIRKVTGGTISTVAGTGFNSYAGDSGPAASASLNQPRDVTVDGAGNLFIADTSNHRIRKVTTGGTISTVAGNGVQGFTGDGVAATSSSLNFPRGVAVDSAGNIYIADTSNVRIRRVDPAGMISTVTGTGFGGLSGDNSLAAVGRVSGPQGVAVDAAGNLYIADSNNDRIRKIASATQPISCSASPQTLSLLPGGFALHQFPFFCTHVGLTWTAAASTTSGGNWLFGGGGGVTPQNVFDSASAGGLTPGTYQGTMTITVQSVATPLVVSWTLTVVSPPTSGPNINTVAGSTWIFPASANNGPATSAPLANMQKVALDAAGNVFAADTQNHNVVKITPTGTLTIVAGNGTQGFSGDNGPATSAQLRFPRGIAVDGLGNLFISDQGNNRIRKVSTTGTITTLAGNGTFGYSGDGGAATSAMLASPEGLAVHANMHLYIADADNSRIRMVDLGTGIISTVAGNGTFGFSGDGGPAASAALNTPVGVAVDASDILYIADLGNVRVRKVNAARTSITTIAGTGTAGFTGDGGPATSAQLASPFGVQLDGAGNVYIADRGSSQRVRKITTSTGTITTVAGNGARGFFGDSGSATSAALANPSDAAVDANANLYIADSANTRIRKVVPAGTISTFAGNGLFKYSGDGGAATSAHLRAPSGAAVDGAGNLYFATPASHRIRKVTPGGIISTVAGNGIGAFAGDGGAPTNASLNNPFDVKVDAAGNLYIADSLNNRIRKVSTSGTITTIAGTGVAGFSGDGGPATSAMLNNPQGLALDAAGNIYIADRNNRRVRKVSPAGIITTVAGDGRGGFSGDGGLATGAGLGNVQGIALDATGSLYIAIPNHHRIRKITPDGRITTVAGNGVNNFTGDGIPAVAASLNGPNGVALDGAGNLYIADSNNNRVRRVSSTDGIISTVSGDGNFDFAGDGGLAALARLNFPQGLAVASGNLYIADGNNDRIRICASCATTAGGTVSAGSGGGTAGSTVQIPITLSLNSGVSIDSLSFGFRVIPNGTAPALSGALTFSKDASIANNPIVDTAETADQISVAWLGNLSPALSGTNCTTAAPCRLGTVGVTIPANAANGQTYTVRITGASGTLGTNDVALSLGLDATLTVAPLDYLVGDVALLVSAAGNLNGDADTDDAGEFGNELLSTTDLIIALRAVTNLPGWRPPTCSDRYDAMDSAPADGAGRGGNGTLSTTDLIITLRRVTGIDTSRPRRASRGLTCP